MAAADKAEADKKGPSLLIQLALFAVLTAAAIGAGWLAGARLVPADDAETAQAATARHHGDDDDNAGETEIPTPPDVVPLEPITVNLAEPSSVWARLEVSLVFDGPPDTALAQAIHQDLLAYLRTVRLEQFRSPSGFQHLKTDIEERAGIRSGGRVKQVLVRTLLFE